MNLPYQFHNQELLKLTFTHPSCTKNSTAEESNYQRLEFLGDSILSMVISEILYKKFVCDSEGQMSIMLSNLVNSRTLASVAQRLGLGALLIMDEGEEMSGGRQNSKNLENVMEALIAAVYLDSNYESVFNFIEQLWRPLLEDASIAEKDKKSLLQEWSQLHKYQLPLYTIESREGLAHSPLFTVLVTVHDLKAKGQGRSRKEAEHNAATALLKIIEKSGYHE